MSTALRHVGIDFGELQHFHDGLGEFSRQFGTHLAAEAVRLREQHRVALHFHLPSAWHGLFGDEVSYLDVTRAQRHWHRSAVRFDVWHHLHQLIRQRPPMGARHVITTLHDLNAAYAKTGFSRWRAMRKQVKLLRRADQIICISDHVLNDLRRLTPLNTPAHRVYNGVADLGAVTPVPVASLTERRFLFHIGRMTPNKNVGSLIALAQAWPEQLFVFAGPRTGYTEGHRDAAQAQGLRNVEFLFDVADGEKAWLYAQCDGLLFPSITEGFGLPPIEAMGLGAPVFLSRCTCLPEIGGALARYFERTTPESMRQLIETDWQATPPHDPSARLARQHWARQFSWPACTHHYIEAYLKALGPAI